MKLCEIRRALELGGPLNQKDLDFFNLGKFKRDARLVTPNGLPMTVIESKGNNILVAHEDIRDFTNHRMELWVCEIVKRWVAVAEAVITNRTYFMSDSAEVEVRWLAFDPRLEVENAILKCKFDSAFFRIPNSHERAR